MVGWESLIDRRRGVTDKGGEECFRVRSHYKQSRAEWSRADVGLCGIEKNTGIAIPVF